MRMYWGLGMRLYTGLGMRLYTGLGMRLGVTMLCLMCRYQMKTEGKCIKTVNCLLNFLYKYDPSE